MKATNSRLFDQLSRAVREVLPEGAGQLQDDVRKNLQATLATALERMDVVSREEFDVQAAVLARTREKLTALEDKVAHLEQELLEKAAASEAPREQE